MLFSTRFIVAFALMVAILASPASAQLFKRRKARRPVTVTAKKEVVAATKMNIVDTAIKAGTFKTLAAALQAADLVDTLKGKGPFTVFPPRMRRLRNCPKARWNTCSSPRTRSI